MIMVTPRSGAFLALALVAAGSPARARPVAPTRVISCAAGRCLLIRGHRASVRDGVRINGRPVDVSGGTSWRVRLPIATIRDWSAPFARTLEVAVADPAGSAGRGEAVPLPVGLLAGKAELASLVVRAR